jgi:hypothetical protein
MNNEIKNLIKNSLENLIDGVEIEIKENGIEFNEYEVNCKIYFEDEKVVYELEEDCKIKIKVNKEIFLKDIEKCTELLYNWSFVLTEGDRENSLYDDENNEDFIREDEVIELEDEEFFNI